ncbi:MAG: histidine kinase dimerization/phospho-acceptor domain-containing protein, partial [Bacilli bacterium]|nr:histidine kinase dimerization/phospho-acceptor domain-containing protein [Bacilli bacterium]
MMTIAVDFAVNITGLLFLIFMMVVYFSKKNMNNIDNMLFKLLLLFNFLNSFIHIFFLLFQWYSIRNDALLLLIIRGYWIPIQCYLVVMTFYLLIALKGSDPDFNNKLLANKKKFYIYLWGSLGIITIIFAFCPISLVYDNTGILAGMTGFGTILFYLFLIIFYLMVLVSLIIFRKKNTKEKILPFKVLAIFLTAGFILSAMYPQLCVTEFLITILSYLMFHTIENPDLKLVNQLTLAKNEAEKASNAKSEFLSSMSHELRTPLNAIVGLSTMIKEEQTREEINRDADDILKASNNLLELVDGILDINKLESNNMEIVNSSYNPKELFDSIEKSTKIRIGDKPIEYRSRISEDL